MRRALSRLDGAATDEAAALLRACCGSSRWVEEMLATRPFGSEGTLRDAADRVWRGLSPADWREAFAHHPRIGEQRSAGPERARAGRWSAREQSSVATASSDVRRALAAVNREYEARFGYIYIVCASGRSAAEMLELARQRLTNSPDEELRVAAEEQRKITQLRLGKLLDDLEAR